MLDSLGGSREVEMSKEHLKKNTLHLAMMDQLSIERGSQELGGRGGEEGGSQWDLIRI